jgi:steroid Delta-isomerase
MPNAADRARAIAGAVNGYLALLATGGVDDLTGMYADDATLEDPVGGEVRIGSCARCASVRG